MTTTRIQPARLLRRLRRDTRGAYTIELAMITPVFLLVVMGTFDLGVQMYAKEALAGVVAQAARDSTLETNVNNQSALDQRVRDRMNTIARWGTVSFTRTNYTDFSSVGQAENFTDSNGNGVRNVGECYSDINANGQWDADRGESGQGGANDVVIFRATFTYDRMFPLWRMMGQSQNKSIVMSSAVRNQPYSNQTDNTVVRCT